MCTISFNSPKYPVSEVQLSSLFSYHFTNMITSVQNIEVICISSYGGKFQPQHPMFLSMSSYSFSRVSWVFIFSFIGFHFAAVISIFSFTYLFFSQINLLFVIFNLVQQKYSSLSLLKNMDYRIFGNNSFAISCAFLSFFLFLILVFNCTAQQAGSHFPSQGWSLHSLQQKYRVLTTGQPGKSCVLCL